MRYAARFRRPPPGAELPVVGSSAEPAVRFAHESERQLAELLDFYGVAWEYEPTEFVLERDSLGRPTEAFRPDFYLPAFDVYVEVTTLNQKLVTRKNRKVRRLKEQYPDVEVKVLYQRDCQALLGRHQLAS